MDAEINPETRNDNLEEFINFHFSKFESFLDTKGVPSDEDVRRDFLKSFLSEIFDVDPREFFLVFLQFVFLFAVSSCRKLLFTVHRIFSG